MTTQNKAIVRRITEECWNKGTEKTADELVAANAPSHDPTAPSIPNGPAGLKQQVAMYRAAFPDLWFSIDEQVAEGDLVVTRWTARGTHDGSLMGAAPTHRKCTVTGIQIDKISNGKVVES